MISSTLTSKSEDVDVGMMPASTCENNNEDLNPEYDADAVAGGESSNILFNPEETENVEISKGNNQA